MVTAISKSQTLGVLTAVTVAVTGLFIFLSPKTVSAVSAYDDVITKGSSIGVRYNWLVEDPYSAVTGHTNDRCHDTVQNDMVNGSWYTAMADYISALGSGSQKTNLTAFKTRIDNAVSSGTGGWGITIEKDNATGTEAYRIISWTGTPTIDWYPLGHGTYANGAAIINGANNTLQYIDIDPGCSIFNTSDPPPYMAYPGTVTQPSTGDLRIDNNVASSINISGHTINTETQVVFLSGTINFNYQSGYEGAMIPTDLNFQLGSETFADFDVQIEAFDITATYRGTQYDDPKCTALIWRFVNADDPLAIYQHHTTITEPLQLKANESGTYRLDLTWEWRITQMDLVGLNPADEDYCQDLNDEIIDLYNDGLLPRDTGKVFPVDGLSSMFLGANGNRECFQDDEPGNGFGDSNVCVYSPDIALEDCSIYGLDELHTRLGCEINNLFVRFRNLWNDMWGVRPYFVSNRLQDFNNHVQENMSILTYPVAFASEMVSITASSTTACPDTEFAFMGATADIDLCQMETMNPATWTFIQVGVTSVFAFMFVAVLHGAYHRLWSSSDV